MPDLSEHPRRERIGEVLEEAIALGKSSVNANMWGYYASSLPVVAFDFTVSRHRDGPDDIFRDFTLTLALRWLEVTRLLVPLDPYFWMVGASRASLPNRSTELTKDR